MTPPKESALYQSRSLPTEAEMKETIESMAIHDPYSLPDLPTIDSVIAAAQTEYASEYADYQKELEEWKKVPDRDPEEEPATPEFKIPDLQKICPAYSFRDDSIKRDVVPRNSDTFRIGSGYYYGNNEEKGLIEYINDGEYKALIDVWPEDFRRKLNRSCHSSALLETTKIQRGHDLSYHVRGRYDTFVESCIALQRAMLVLELRKSCHIRTLGEIELRSEIRLRKKQYPGQQIIVMLGENLKEYYMNVFHGEHLLEGALLTDAPRKSSYRTQPRDFGGYESAIVAPPQIKASHAFEFNYTMMRVDRGWRVAIGMLMNFGIQVTPRLEERATTTDTRQQSLFS